MVMPVHVKICGITRVEDALSAARLGADAIGFVFWPKSTRAVLPDIAGQITEKLPAFVSTVGVYVNPTRNWVEETATRAGLTLLQFHGDESPEFCNQFSLPYIKAIRVRSGIDLLQYAARYSNSKGLLLDTYSVNMPGGTGHVFDWDLIPQDLPLPFILSGGLHSGNVALAIKQTRPWAVDVSSGVEAVKGIKDETKISAFMQGVRNSECL
ncbi:phosphoribosylanthranilate isomerase [Nitrosomonas cryotolerans]|uniref:N-(5'-phosphoribosyl)anthranilate isomerase n=2 Tax=Nitrosomonas cryotolerans TaxID=44575 RepID=A0A1N6IFJ5_9PROT|nr:phosphoribosylanthranilate isomerase [Nitrosomonas cryotolerans]SIO30806.1 phosphoribosylanthranilate isomerase [Nitrosomonas cryotolerans ATCC 49181]